MLALSGILHAGNVLIPIYLIDYEFVFLAGV